MTSAINWSRECNNLKLGKAIIHKEVQADYSFRL